MLTPCFFCKKKKLLPKNEKIKITLYHLVKTEDAKQKSKTSAVNLHYFSIFEILKKKQHIEQ